VVGRWHGYLSGRGADLHMAQLMPLPLTDRSYQVSSTLVERWGMGAPKLRILPNWGYTNKSRLVLPSCFTLLVSAHLGSPGHSPGAVKQL